MATEAGHAPNRIYMAQDGSLHLNGGAFYNDAEADISASLETAMGGSSGGQKLVGGTLTNSTTGVQAVATGLSGIISAWAIRLSTAQPSTAAGVPWWFGVGFSTGSGTLDIAAWKPTSSAIPEAILATSSATSLSWAALGYV